MNAFHNVGLLRSRLKISVLHVLVRKGIEACLAFAEEPDAEPVGTQDRLKPILFLPPQLPSYQL